MCSILWGPRDDQPFLGIFKWKIKSHSTSPLVVVPGLAGIRMSIRCPLAMYEVNISVVLHGFVFFVQVRRNGHGI